MKSLKLNPHEVSSLIALASDAKLDFLTPSKAAHLALAQGIPIIRKLYVKTKNGGAK